jgi:predicted alpha/beta-hydrolase family hydrolase
MKSVTFTATVDKGDVSALLQSAEDPKALLVLAHGAGANMQHVHMQSIADALGAAGISTFRFNFPYMEAGGGRTDSKHVCIDTFESAVATATSLAPNLELFIGGHSFGGRMSSHYAAEQAPAISGLVYFSFPLHPAKKPGTQRADHMVELAYPQLFLSGTRDDLAEQELLRDVTSRLKNATLHEIDTANHSFKVLKRSRQSAESVYKEAARVLRAWIQDQ